MIELVPDRFTLGEFFSETCARHADRVALRFSGYTVTYGELEADVRAVARGLIRAGVVKGARVGLLMGNRPEWIISAFATWLVGGVLVPISTFAREGERDHVLRHADVSLLLMQRKLLKRDFVDELLASHPALADATSGRLRLVALPQLRRIVCFGSSDGPGGVETTRSLFERIDVNDELLDALRTGITPSDDALIVYTSGTSAEPKGIVHRHRAPVIQSLHFARSMGLDPEDRMWTAQPFFWAAGIAVSLGATLASGASLILQETFDALEALELIERERATVIRGWPHQEKAMAEHPSAPSRDLASVKKLNYTSPLARLVGLSRDEWGTQGGYGLSETFTVVTDLPATAPAAIRLGTSGLPLEGAEVRIIDPETGAQLPANTSGEIAVRGRTLMRGYHKVDPERCFDEHGFFRTRDGGFLDENGYLHWTGRLSDMIKTGGANVAPIEIERALVGYPGLRISSAIGVPHPTLGEAVVLCVVPTDEAAASDAVDEAGIRAFLRERLASYKVPKRVLRFSAADIERTGTDKVRVEKLRGIALERLREKRIEIDGYVYAAEPDLDAR